MHGLLDMHQPRLSDALNATGIAWGKCLDFGNVRVCEGWITPSRRPRWTAASAGQSYLQGAVSARARTNARRNRDGLKESGAGGRILTRTFHPLRRDLGVRLQRTRHVLLSMRLWSGEDSADQGDGGSLSLKRFGTSREWGWWWWSEIESGGG